MDSLLADLRLALRTLARSPGFAAVAILTLAIGIGANSVIFSVVNAALWRSLPYDEPERLCSLEEVNVAQGQAGFGVSYPNFTDWRDQNDVFQQVAATRVGTAALTGDGEPVRLPVALVSGDIFRLLRFAPALGRTFTSEEDRLGGPRAVVLGHRFWKNRRGSNPSVLGNPVVLDGDVYTVIGVMPEGFSWPSSDVEAWIAIGPASGFMQNRAVHVLDVSARLRDGVTFEEAGARLKAIASRIQLADPASDPGHGRNVKPALLVLLGAVSFVLLIACANIANLLLARGAGRRREMAVRAALGARRARLLRQVMTESVVIALLGGAAGLLLAQWSAEALIAGSPVASPAPGAGLDVRVLAWTLGVSILTGLLCGAAPALRASGIELMAALRADGTRLTGSGARHGFGHALLVAEIALSMILLTGAGLLIRSLDRLISVDPGFQSDHLLTMSVDLLGARYEKRDEVIRFFRDLPARLESLPGVEAVSAVSALPVSLGDSRGDLTVEERPFRPGEALAASYRRILPNYFATMGIPLVQGREFDDHDTGDGEKVVVINESMARELWPGGDPLGKRIKVGPAANEPWLTIVGVVGDVKNIRLDADREFATYEPHPQRPWSGMSVVVRTRTDPAALTGAVRGRLLESGGEILVDRASTMGDRIHFSVSDRRFTMRLLAAFAITALFLAAIGIYGVSSYVVTQRTREIGLRIALGAGRRDVLKLVLGRIVTLLILGVPAGILASLALSRVLASQLFGVSPTDPVTFAAVSTTLAIAALLAGYLPARRAMAVDPMTSLRYE